MEKLEYLLKKNGNLGIGTKWNADWFSLRLRIGLCNFLDRKQVGRQNLVRANQEQGTMALQLFMKELLVDSVSCYPGDVSIVSGNARVTRNARPLFMMLDHKHKEDRDRWRRITKTRSESDSCMVVPTPQRYFSPQEKPKVTRSCQL
jgi:hypothetical protein